MIEELKNIKISPKDLRQFGLLVGGIFLGLGILFLFLKKSPSLYDSFIVIGALLMLAGTLSPRALKTPYRLWMSLAILLGWCMSRVVLTILFYGVLTPTTLLARVFGKKFLDLRPDPSRNSYWEIRSEKIAPKDSYEKQF